MRPKILPLRQQIVSHETISETHAKIGLLTTCENHGRARLLPSPNGSEWRIANSKWRMASSEWQGVLEGSAPALPFKILVVLLHRCQIVAAMFHMKHLPSGESRNLTALCCEMFHMKQFRKPMQNLGFLAAQNFVALGQCQCFT